MKIEMPPCPGKTYVHDITRKWYIPPGKDSAQSTWCEKCYYTHVPVGDCEGWRMITNVPGCNCDSQADRCPMNLVSVSPNFEAAILDATTGAPLTPFARPSANANGVFHVVVPTATHYSIYVKIKGTKDYFWIPKVLVGEREAEVSRAVRFGNDHTISGFKEGTDESFMFVSLTPKCIEAGMEVPEQNKSNIITVELQRCQRVHAPERALFGGGNFMQTATRGSGGFSFGGPSANFNSSCFGGATTFGGSPPLAKSSFSGGATMSGGRDVGKTPAAPSDDRFPDIGERIKFVFQLVCLEDEETRFRKNFEAFHELERKKAQKTLNDFKWRLAECEKEVKRCDDLIFSLKQRTEAEESCRAFNQSHIKFFKEKITEVEAIVGKPEDHLMKFD